MFAWRLRVLLAGVRIQLSRGRGGNFLLAAVVTPVLYGAVIVLMGRYFGRASELAPFLVVGPAILGVWQTALLTGGEAVADERGVGTFELLIAAPASTELVILGRVAGNTLLALVAIPEVFVMAALLGADVRIADPLAAAIAVLGLALSTLAISLVYSSTFVLARTTRVFQNVIGFPTYIVSGIAFPLALLPTWLQPLSSVISLTWVAALLRSSFRGDAAAVLPSAAAALIALTAAYGLVGHVMFTRIENAIRANGKVTLAS